MKVYVRGQLGDLKRLALIEISEGVAYVCAEGVLGAIERGERERPIFGFALSDVFTSDVLDEPLLAADDSRIRQLIPIAQ